MLTAPRAGAHVRVRTGDLFLTKEVLCLLSYVGPRRSVSRPATDERSVVDSAILDNHRSTLGNLGLRPRIGCPAGGSSDGKPSQPEGWWAGRESNPHSRKTADLQSAELTTCSTYPRNRRRVGTSPTEAGVYRTAMGASTDGQSPSGGAPEHPSVAHPLDLADAFVLGRDVGLVRRSMRLR